MWPCSVVLGKVCVDKGHQRGSAGKGGLVLRLCCVPDQMLAAYLRIRNILPRMPRSVWDCESDCLIVSLVWCIRQGALSRFIKRDGHTVHLVYKENTWSLKRGLCVPSGLKCKFLRARYTGDILLLPRDPSLS